MREKDIESHLTRRVAALGGLAWKLVSPGTAGVPDRIVVVPTPQGATIGFLELKAPGEQLRPLQLERLETLTKLGAPAGWASSFAGVDAFLAALVAGRDSQPVQGAAA